jgi:hypothetical protein
VVATMKDVPQVSYLRVAANVRILPSPPA